jgi:nucleotide-binding universal stress UspA family protein
VGVTVPSCAGLDVHQRRVIAHRITPNPTGPQVNGRIATRVFTTPCPRQEISMLQTVLLAVSWHEGDVPTPAAAGARALAIQLASQTASPLYVVTAYHSPPLPYVPHPFSPPGTGAALIRRLHAQEQAAHHIIEANLRAYIREIECAGIEVVLLVRAGDPSEVLMRVAAEIHADAMVLGTPGTRWGPRSNHGKMCVKPVSR